MWYHQDLERILLGFLETSVHVLAGKGRTDCFLPAGLLPSPVRISLEDLSVTIKNMFGGFTLNGNCNLT
jgi:hypothetical protein